VCFAGVGVKESSFSRGPPRGTKDLGRLRALDRLPFRCPRQEPCRAASGRAIPGSNIGARSRAIRWAKTVLRENPDGNNRHTAPWSFAVSDFKNLRPLLGGPASPAHAKRRI